ncbi:hypothetical protein II906_06215, partial [bacterium]|nr:hypothetical protein [bacterium]
LKVTVTNKTSGLVSELTLGIDYTIHEIGNSNGSYITYPIEGSSHSKLSSDEFITLSLDLPIEQSSEFKNASDLKLSTLEWTFDYIVRVLQILNRKSERAVKVQEGSSVTADSLLNQIQENINSSVLYADKSKKWAVHTGLVDSEDYSSKYYAQQAANSAQTANEKAALIEAKSYFTTRDIGEIVTSTIPLSDSGLHLLDGSLISGSGTYSDFVDYIADIYDANSNYFCTEVQWQASITAYGVCGKFVYDSVNNTVRLPKITGFIEGAAGVSTLGNLTEAGLPNITGSIQTDGGGNLFSDSELYTTDGCLSPIIVNQNNIANASASSNSLGGFSIDASDSSSIYGNSDTVQPQSVKVLYYIVIATSTKTEILADIDQIATDLNGKADVDCSNMNASVKKFDGQWVYSPQVFSTATALSTVDLTSVVSSYLPNDNYTYEILMTNRISRNDSNGTNSVVFVYNPDLLDTTLPNTPGYFSELEVDGTNFNQNNNTFIAIIYADRKLSYKIQSYKLTDSSSLCAVAYRRVGTNG